MCPTCARRGGNVTSRGSDRPEEAENAGEQNVCSCNVASTCPRQHKKDTKCDQPIARGVYCERCICSCDGTCSGACEGVRGACLRGGRRAKQGMCPTCARGGGRPIKGAEAAGTKEVNLEEVEPDPTTSLPTEHKELLAVAKKEGVYM